MCVSVNVQKCGHMYMDVRALARMCFCVCAHAASERVCVYVCVCVCARAFPHVC